MIITLGTTQGVQRTMVFDRVSLDHVNRSTHVHDHASAKSVNVARIVHALGGEALAMGFLGGDTGNFCRHDLTSLGVRHSFIQVSHPTRICITVIDRANKQTTELVEETAPVEQDNVKDLFELLKAHISRAKMLVLSGTLAAGVENDLYARCVRLANEHRVPTLVDAKGEAMKLAIRESPTWIKPNKSEVEATVGHPIESEDALLAAIKELSQLGAKNILVTRGPGRAILHDGSATRTFEIPKVDAVNPIGSGDSVAAGIAVGWTQGKSAVDCARLGLACGVANALTLYSAHINLADVERILPMIV